MSDYTPEELAFIERMKGEAIHCLVKMPTGEWAGLHQFFFTTGLLLGVTDMDAYRIRYCYQDSRQALIALLAWDGQGRPPGPWIKEKGRRLDGTYADNTNPNLEKPDGDADVQG